MREAVIEPGEDKLFVLVQVRLLWTHADSLNLSQDLCTEAVSCSAIQVLVGSKSDVDFTR